MLTQEYLKSILDYDRDTGIFTWKDKMYKSRKKIGDIAGCINNKDGYIQISIKRKIYKAHRLAWLYEYGEMPKVIDHINRIKTDNRISNIRNTTQKENNKNMPRNSRNTSGVIGVVWDKTKSRWLARITVDYKVKTLGVFVDFSEAVNARKNAEVLYGYHENHGKTLEEIQGAEYE